MSAAALATLLALPACALQSYAPRPLDTQAAAASFAARTADDPGLKRYMLAHGHAESEWPVPQWGLSELTLLAFYYHPDLAVARAKAAAARAEAAVAAQPRVLGVSPELEHHSRESDDQSSPWSVGFEIEIPVASGSRREAIAERADLLAQAAELDVAATTWEVRSRLRARLVDLHAARVEAESARTEVEARKAVAGLLERRLEAGYVGANELSTARVSLAEAAARLAAAQTRGQQAQGELAAALGIPLARLAPLALDFTALDALPDAPGEAELRAAALTNRIDLRRRLLEFSADDAAVKLEIARQYPEIILRPGYLWDQGDNVWRIAASFILAPTQRSGASIRRAEAQREAAAATVLQQQSAIIGEASAAVATYGEAAANVKAAQQLSRMQLARNTLVQKRFDAGDADRLDLQLSRLEAIAADRNAQAARLEAQKSLGRLEDVLQRPLAGGPLPALPAER
jgi:outer membrane protein TolC